VIKIFIFAIKVCKKNFRQRD